MLIIETFSETFLRLILCKKWKNFRHFEPFEMCHEDFHRCWHEKKGRKLPYRAKLCRAKVKSLVGSLVLNFKTLLLLLGKTFRLAKMTNFSFGDENFARQSFAR